MTTVACPTLEDAIRSKAGIIRVTTLCLIIKALKVYLNLLHFQNIVGHSESAGLVTLTSGRVATSQLVAAREMVTDSGRQNAQALKASLTNTDNSLSTIPLQGGTRKRKAATESDNHDELAPLLANPRL